MQRLKEAGKCRFIGVTGLPLAVFTRVLDSVASGLLDTVLSYCHYELNDTSLLTILPDLKEHGVGVINASPLGMGLLSRREAPGWHPAPAHVKRVCADAAAYCQRRGADIAKLAVQFSVAEPRIPTTLVGTSNPTNIRNNVKWVEEPIDEELLAEVLAILKPISDVTWRSGRLENN